MADWFAKGAVIAALCALLFLSACSRPIDTAFIHDMCLSSDSVSLLLRRKQGTTTTTPGPHPSIKTQWHQFSTYRVSYVFNILGEVDSPAPTPAIVEKLNENRQPSEFDKRPTFANQNLPCEFSEADHYENVSKVIYFSDKNYEITGFVGKKTTAWAFEDEQGQCYLKKTLPPGSNFIVSCPFAGLMAKRQFKGDHSFYIDSKRQQIILIEGDNAADHLIPGSDKRLTIWRYRSGEALQYRLAGVKKL